MARKYFYYNGKQYSVQRKNPADLPMAVAEKLMQLKSEDIKESEILFKDYALQWLEVFKKPYVSRSSTDTYRNQIKVLGTYFGWKRMKDVTSTDLQGALNSEYASGRSNSSISKTYMTINQVFERAEIDRLIKFNPAKGLVKPSAEEQQERALTDDEYEQIRKVCKTSRYGMWILSMLLLGLRPGEAARMKKEHYDPQTELMYIDGTKSKRAKRYIPLCEPLKSFVSNFNGEGYLFTTSGGKPLTEQQTQRWWKYFKRDWDLSLGAKTYRNQIIESKISPDVHLYMLRHTFATKMASKVPVNVLADILGHSNVNIAYKYYIHYNKENMDRVKNAMYTI